MSYDDHNHKINQFQSDWFIMQILNPRYQGKVLREYVQTKLVKKEVRCGTCRYILMYEEVDPTLSSVTTNLLKNSQAEIFNACKDKQRKTEEAIESRDYRNQ